MTMYRWIVILPLMGVLTADTLAGWFLENVPGVLTTKLKINFKFNDFEIKQINQYIIHGRISTC